MRVWDIPVKQLCNKHLIAQHHEIHCIASILKKKYYGEKTGFANHPEVLRWSNNEIGLAWMHLQTSLEMIHRGIAHNQSNDSSGRLHYIQWNYQYREQPVLWQSIEQQIALLKSKGCECKIS